MGVVAAGLSSPPDITSTTRIAPPISAAPPSPAHSIARDRGRCPTTLAPKPCDSNMLSVDDASRGSDGRGSTWRGSPCRESTDRGSIDRGSSASGIEARPVPAAIPPGREPLVGAPWLPLAPLVPARPLAAGQLAPGPISDARSGSPSPVITSMSTPPSEPAATCGRDRAAASSSALS